MRRPALCGSAVIAAAGAAWGILPATALAATDPSVTLTAQGATGKTVTGSGQFAASGDTAVSISVAQLSGGSAVTTSGPSSALPTAVQFPAYVASGTYPRAVVRVTPTSGKGLDPGSSDFEYGAVFRQDTTSSGRSIDNGDNVFQRGISSETSMFKLEVDNGHAACKVSGSGGEVTVRSAMTLSRNTWYTASCSRVGSTLSVAVKTYASTGAAAKTSAQGTLGTLSFASGRPATIGGKVNASGEIVSSATDQFNGAVAQVWAERL